MSPEQSSFLEELALYFEQLGLTRASGRIFGYLLVSENENVSFQEFEESLHISKGSLSMTLKSLEQVGFVEKVSLSGDRKTYYRFVDNAFHSMMSKRNIMLLKFAEILNKAVSLRSDSKDTTSERIEHMSEFFIWLTTQIDDLIEKWKHSKKSS